nr:MAG TPA: hypothetical protein [Bacteriophage sp.]
MTILQRNIAAGRQEEVSGPLLLPCWEIFEETM